MFGSLLMAAMHGLLNFGSDNNAFVTIGTFGFSVTLAILKNEMAHEMVDDLVVKGVQKHVSLEVY